MNDAINHILSNPVLVTICTIAGLLFVFFILKKLFKVALILILVGLIALFLYEGLTTPGGYKEKIKGAYDKTKMQGEDVLKKGKDKMVSEGKELTSGIGSSVTQKKKIIERSKSPED
jgi:hypothetical protein